MSSNIPLARKWLADIIEMGQMDNATRKHLRSVLALMTRSPPVKRAASAPRLNVTPHLRASVMKLARDGKSHHQIANALNIANVGRVSEIMNGKR